MSQCIRKRKEIEVRLNNKLLATLTIVIFALSSVAVATPVSAHTTLGLSTPQFPNYNSESDVHPFHNPGPLGYVFPGSGIGPLSFSATPVTPLFGSIYNTYPPGYQAPNPSGYPNRISGASGAPASDIYQLQSGVYSPFGAILTSTSDHKNTGPLIFALNFSHPERFFGIPSCNDRLLVPKTVSIGPNPPGVTTPTVTYNILVDTDTTCSGTPTYFGDHPTEKQNGITGNAAQAGEAYDPGVMCGRIGAGYCENYTSVDIYVPPEFDLSTAVNNPGLVTASFAANGFVDGSQDRYIRKADPRDPFGPGWWVIHQLGDIHFWPQHAYQEWYYIRVNGVAAPTIAGKYFFKMFLGDQFLTYTWPGMPRTVNMNGYVCNPRSDSSGFGSSNDICAQGLTQSRGADDTLRVPTTEATNATVPVTNWPVLLVKGEIDPGIVTGTVRYGTFNTTLYSIPINDAGKVFMNGTANDPYTGLPTGRKVAAMGYFNASAAGHYEVEGVAPGTYTIYAQAAGFPLQVIATGATILPGQAFHLDGYINPGAIVHGQVNSKHLFGTQPWPTEPRCISVDIYTRNTYTPANLISWSPRNATHPPYTCYNWQYLNNGTIPSARPEPKPVAFPWATYGGSQAKLTSYYTTTYTNTNPLLNCGGGLEYEFLYPHSGATHCTYTDWLCNGLNPSGFTTNCAATNPATGLAETVICGRGTTTSNFTDRCGVHNGVGPAEYWWVDSQGVFTNGGGSSSFNFQFGVKGIFGTPTSYDGHVPQTFATWTGGLNAGRYWIRALVNGYVQTLQDGVTFDQYYFDIAPNEWAGDIFMPMDIRVSSLINATVHFHDQPNTLTDCPINGCIGNAAQALSQGGRVLIGELRDSSGNLVGMNFTGVTCNTQNSGVTFGNIGNENGFSVNPDGSVRLNQPFSNGINNPTPTAGNGPTCYSSYPLEINGFGMMGPDTLNMKWSYDRFQGYDDYGIPSGTYTLYVYMRGYVQLALPAVSVTLSGSPATMSLHLVRGARFNVTAYSIDWEHPSRPLPWRFQGARLQTWLFNSAGQALPPIGVFLTYGYFDHLFATTSTNCGITAGCAKATSLGFTSGVPTRDPPTCTATIPASAGPKCNFGPASGGLGGLSAVSVRLLGDDPRRQPFYGFYVGAGASSAGTFVGAETTDCSLSFAGQSCTDTTFRINEYDGGKIADDYGPWQSLIRNYETGGSFFPFYQDTGFLPTPAWYRQGPAAGFKSNFAFPADTYSAFIFTYGYVQHQVFSAGVPLGGFGIVRVNLLEGVNVTVNVPFKKEGVYTPTAFNMSMRVRVFDDSGNLVATQSTPAPDVGPTPSFFAGPFRTVTNPKNDLFVNNFGLGRNVGSAVSPTTAGYENYFVDPYALSPSVLNGLTSIQGGAVTGDGFIWHGSFSEVNACVGATVNAWQAFDSDPCHKGASSFGTINQYNGVNGNRGYDRWITSIPAGTDQVRIFTAGISDMFDPLTVNAGSGVLHTKKWDPTLLIGERVDTVLYGIDGFSSTIPNSYTGGWTVEVSTENWYPSPTEKNNLLVEGISGGVTITGLMPPVTNWMPAVEGLLQGESFNTVPGSPAGPFGYTGTSLAANQLGPYAQQAPWSIPNAHLGSEASAVYELDKRGYVSSNIYGFAIANRLRTQSWASITAAAATGNLTFPGYVADGYSAMYVEPGTYKLSIALWTPSGNQGLTSASTSLTITPGQATSGGTFQLEQSKIPIPEFNGLALVAFSALGACLYILQRRRLR